MLIVPSSAGCNCNVIWSLPLLALRFSCNKTCSTAVGNPVVAKHLQATSAAEKRHSQNAMLMLARVDAFPAGGAYVQQVAALRDALKAMPKAQGVSHIHLPGERRRMHWQNSQDNGVTVDTPVWQALAALAQAHGVGLPPTRP